MSYRRTAILAILALGSRLSVSSTALGRPETDNTSDSLATARTRTKTDLRRSGGAAGTVSTIPTRSLTEHQGRSDGKTTIIYVDDDAPPGGDGTSWDTAYNNLRDVLNQVEPNTEIRVAGGRYRPRSTYFSSQNYTFQLKSNVAVYGGYAGLADPSNPDFRDVEAYETVLSGDRAGDDEPVPCNQDAPDCDSFGHRCIDGYCILERNTYENNYHVVTGSGTEDTAILDGVTITAGNASGASGSIDGGGGVLIQDGNPRFVNCTFEKNRAGAGGGIWIRRGWPTLIGCSFIRNWARYHGGGMGGRDYANPTLVGCEFRQNVSSKRGGGMYSVEWDSTPIVTTTRFIGNIALDDGGAIYNAGSHATMRKCVFVENAAWRGGAIFNRGHSVFGYYVCSYPTVADSVFDRNTAGYGGAIFNYYGRPRLNNSVFLSNSATSTSGIAGGGALYELYCGSALANCTFRWNSAATSGGAVYVGGGGPWIANSLFWDNTPDEIFLDAISGHTTIKYSNVRGGVPDGVTVDEGGNIDADPVFVEGTLTLSPDSPCIDSGQNTYVAGPSYVLPCFVRDHEGNPRFLDDPDTPDTGMGSGEVPLIDIGAYEYVPPDCNSNGTLDIEEVSADPSLDTNDNDIPDACEPERADCNANNTLDECDIQNDSSHDCNDNGIPDECDIESGTSSDCDNNLWPDECFIGQHDSDSDGVCNPDDNCPALANPAQEDTDGDAIGDACDNCPADPNSKQEDWDGDKTGDVCDLCTDSDGDRYGNPGFPANWCPLDNCPDRPNYDQADFDLDGLGDVCDPCPLMAAPCKWARPYPK